MDPITTAELIAFLSNFFLVKEFTSDVESSGKNKLKNSIKHHKDLSIIEEKLNDLLRRAYKEFDSSTMEEEYDFQGLCEFYGKGFLEKLNRYLTATGSERADIESDILLNAHKAAKGKSQKADERVDKLTQQVLNTIYGFYRDQASQSEKLLAGEVENTVISSTTEIKNDIFGLVICFILVILKDYYFHISSGGGRGRSFGDISDFVNYSVWYSVLVLCKF